MIVRSILYIILVAVFASPSFAADLESRLNSLEETLKKQEQTIQELKALQNTLKTQEQTISEQRKLIEELKAEVRKSQPSVTLSAPEAKEPETSDQIQQQVKELSDKVDEVVEAQKKEIPSVFNPSIGLVGETVFSYRSKGSAQTGSDRPGGFDAFQRSVELNLAASVDPFAKGYAVINASADPGTGESTANVEEAAVQTTSLPWNLELKAGRFFGEFGRLSYIHDHELPFVNRPLALNQYIGGESRTDGAQLNYLLPISHYVSLTVGAGNQFGGDIPPNNVGDFRQGSGLNYWGRASTYFDLTPDISLEPGISGLWNPKTTDLGGGLLQPDGSTFTERERRLLGTDFVLSYRPLRNNQFQTVTWGTEVLYSDNRYDVTLPDGTLSKRAVGSYGLYSYLAYKFHRQWTTGLLFDWVENALNKSDKTTAYSPYITWALSHWSQLRLQYTYTDHNSVSGLLPDHAVYLQWAWIIGSHSHGWQQR
ncbi:MAG TPA: hypothetical protein VMT62_17805 [Syntrophorhabdaceae bacterium]|nr:hypothetical protein [Syntrophorhabdaceae bacterium]